MRLADRLAREYKEFCFVKSGTDYWNPNNSTVYYRNDRTKEGKYSLLHELGHALSSHYSYDYDIELIKMEIEAWQRARQISTKYKVTIPESHIQDCLNSYRDWMNKRSICPKCLSGNFQKKSLLFDCYQCGLSWQVNNSPLCQKQIFA